MQLVLRPECFFLGVVSTAQRSSLRRTASAGRSWWASVASRRWTCMLTLVCRRLRNCSRALPSKGALETFLATLMLVAWGPCD